MDKALLFAGCKYESTYCIDVYCIKSLELWLWGDALSRRWLRRDYFRFSEVEMLADDVPVGLLAERLDRVDHVIELGVAHARIEADPERIIHDSVGCLQ